MRVENVEMAWVSGWASDISIWEDEIYKRFPDFSHRFVDYWDLISADSDEIPGIGRAGIVVGWSMGTLALLRNLSQKPKEQRWILVCPIADFCACWPRAAVRATTPKSFSDLMDDVPKEEREKWLENAMRYSPEQLTAGLNYLIQKKADLSAANINELEFLFGAKDKIVPLAQKELFPSGKVYENLGHWLPDYFGEIYGMVL
ncbi:MAG: hypothetical protein LBQ87_06395 [Candidatus Fibromonas sp.]|nr:hypothetical protein [Candidatus Fibromonas sp.]